MLSTMVDEVVETFRTPERDYILTKTKFVKRELRPSEYTTKHNGNKHVPRWSRQRLENERDALTFIAKNTTIPVPKILDFFEDDGACSLVVERIGGDTMEIVMENLDEEDKATLARNVTQFVEQKVLPQLRKWKSNRIGGITGHVLPPERVTTRDWRPMWESKIANKEDYVFCHNDLARHNIMVDPITLQPLGVIDWESSGFWPVEFEAAYWLKSFLEYGRDPDAVDVLIKLFNDAPSNPSSPVTVTGPTGRTYTSYESTTGTFTEGAPGSSQRKEVEYSFGLLAGNKQAKGEERSRPCHGSA